ncbi:MAG: CpaD family pilus assembly protein [Xanthobacteraceae bacterium]|nr:CpaD family pilus assembly protein [Xanthobacteraceae bacterium]
MTTTPSASSLHRRKLAGLLIGACFALGACTHTSEEVTGTIPDDYRLRHPIVVENANQTVDVFVGNGRGGLTAAQRADVVGLARTWMHEGTGAITVEVPSHTPNARAAADSLREIRSLLSIGGVPANGVIVRHYRSPSRQFFAPIRLTYPRVKADAGPCGMWPEDLGPSIKNKSYLENKSYWNFGCATQRNLAAMVDNPADLVQPRPETPAYTGRRNVVFDKYRKGERTAAQQTEAEKAKISSVGQ